MEAATCSVAEGVPGKGANSMLGDASYPTFDNEHTCPICFDVLVKPHKVILCGHLFCEVCLRQLQHCRGPIQKCEAKEGLDEIISSKYPWRYQERYKQVQEIMQNLKNSKLPCCETEPPLQSRHLIPRVQRQRVPKPTGLQRLKTILGNIGHGTWLLGWVVFGSLLATHAICTVVLIGHIKFCFAFSDKGKVLFDPETGEHRSVRVYYAMRGASVVVSFAVIKLFYILHWGQIFCMTSLAFGITLLGYSLAGHPENSLFGVMLNSMLYPIRD